jgi:type IV pilus assembly protein PilB
VTDDVVKPIHLVQAGFSKEEAEKVKVAKQKGCEQCKGTGYKGRQGIYEVLENTPDLAEAILNNAQTPELLGIAKKNGFQTMGETGRDYLLKGILSMEEFQRVLS